MLSSFEPTSLPKKECSTDVYLCKLYHFSKQLLDEILLTVASNKKERPV